MANKRFIVRHGLDNSGDNSVVNTIINVAEPVNNSDAATKYYVDTHVTGGTVTSVTATSPVESTGGTTPVISLGTGANGQLVIGTGTGFTKSTLTAGTGVSIANASGSITISATGSGGDVVGPASSTDNAVVRFDGTTGKLIQNSTVTLSDTGVLTVPELSTASITSTGNNPIVIAPDGTGDVHLNADSVRIGDNNTDATLVTRGTGDLLLTTNEGSAVEGVIRIYDGANGNITLTPYGTGQVQVGSDQVVTLTASQTLTNKSLSGSSNTFTNIPNSATTAASTNTASAIVARDASGNFSAGTITATLSGNATNVTGTVAVANGGTGLTTLTAGYIPYGNGTSAFGSSANLFWDSANSRLGIGTSSPRAKLETSGSIFATSRSIPTGGAGPEIWWSGTVSGISSYDRTNSAYKPLLLEAEYSYFTTANGSEQMRINNTGVGIGTASPYNKLEIEGASARLGLNNGGGASRKALLIEPLGYGGNAYARLESYDYGTSTGGVLALNVTGGNVGIGIATPAFKLHTYIASGTSMFKFESGANAGIYGYWTRPNQSYIQALNLDNNGDKDFSLYDATNGQVADRYYPSSTGYRAFFTNGSERMRIDSSGNLGLGTASPTVGLHVVKDQGSGYIAAFRANTSSPYITLQTTSSITQIQGINSAFTDVNNIAMQLSGGNVGIGTSSPSEKLSIKSATSNSVIDIASLTNPSQTSAGVRMLFNNGYGNLCAISSFQLDNGAGADNGVLAFQTASDTVLSTKMTILDSGNVGIGTSSPTNKLQVNGVMVGNNASGSYTKGFGGILTTTSTSTPTGGSSGDFTLIY